MHKKEKDIWYIDTSGEEHNVECKYQFGSISSAKTKNKKLISELSTLRTNSLASEAIC